MQSFMTVFLAAIIAFVGVLMMTPEPTSQNQVYAETISMDVVQDAFVVPSVVIKPVRPLVLALDAYQQFDAELGLPVDVLLSINE